MSPIKSFEKIEPDQVPELPETHFETGSLQFGVGKTDLDETENFGFGQDDDDGGGGFDGFDDYGGDHFGGELNPDPILNPAEGFFKTEQSDQQVERSDRLVGNGVNTEPVDNSSGLKQYFLESD